MSDSNRPTVKLSPREFEAIKIFGLKPDIRRRSVGKSTMGGHVKLILSPELVPAQLKSYMKARKK
jgi:hypothetical protein